MVNGTKASLSDYKRQVKRFYCGNQDVCHFKEHYINNRCWAPYVIRSSCRHFLGEYRDGKYIKGNTVDMES